MLHINIKLIYDIISLLVKKLIKRMYIQPNIYILELHEV